MYHGTVQWHTILVNCLTEESEQIKEYFAWIIGELQNTIIIQISRHRSHQSNIEDYSWRLS